MGRKVVAMQLPPAARAAADGEGYAPELEALAPVADLVEVPSPTPAAFAAGAASPDCWSNLSSPDCW